jgi:hypothetical protein
MATCCSEPLRERIPVFLLPFFLIFLALLAAVTILLLGAGAAVLLVLILIDLLSGGRARVSAPVIAFLRRTLPGVREMASYMAIIDRGTVCRVSSRLYKVSPFLGGLCYKYLNAAVLAALCAAGCTALVLASKLLLK